MRDLRGRGVLRCAAELPTDDSSRRPYTRNSGVCWEFRSGSRFGAIKVTVVEYLAGPRADLTAAPGTF